MDSIPSTADTMRKTDELKVSNEGSIAAMTRSGRIWMAGVQQISQTMAGMAKARIESNMWALRALGEVKSLNEAMELQKHHANQYLQTAIADGSAITNATMKLNEETLAPITENMAARAKSMLTNGFHAA